MREPSMATVLERSSMRDQTARDRNALDTWEGTYRVRGRERRDDLDAFLEHMQTRAAWLNVAWSTRRRLLSRRARFEIRSDGLTRAQDLLLQGLGDMEKNGWITRWGTS